MNPWRPMTNLCDLKHMGKLAEETNELGSAVARCIIQGINEREPVTGKLNKLWLEEEIADVRANDQLVTKRFNLDNDFIEHRKSEKIERLQVWHGMIDDADYRPQPRILHSAAGTLNCGWCSLTRRAHSRRSPAHCRCRRAGSKPTTSAQSHCGQRLLDAAKAAREQ